MNQQTTVMLRRCREHATEIQRILGLPDDRWLDVEVRMTLDDLATAQVTLFLSPEQLHELVDLGVFGAPRINPDDIIHPNGGS